MRAIMSNQRCRLPTRRDFLRQAAFLGALATVLGRRGASAAEAAKGARVRIGACDWSLRKAADPAAFEAAKGLGFEGVEVSCGMPGEHLPISDPKRRASFAEAARASGLAIPSTCLEVLHRDGLKSSEKGPKWVEEAIAPTKDLGAKVILLPMFYGMAIAKRSEQKAVADRLKAIAPAAEKAGVVLGLENSISAEDNAWIIDQVGSKAVKVYYDSGNSFYGVESGPFDIYKEVVWLGKDRICQIHLKERGPMGKGKIDFVRFAEAVVKSGFAGWIVLETEPKTMPDEVVLTKGLFKRPGA